MSQKRIVFVLVVAVIGIAVGLILLGRIENGRKTKFTNIVTPMRSAMTVLVACRVGGDSVNKPILSGGNQICPAGNPADLWPSLKWNWTYELAGSNFGNDCLIRINPNDGGPMVVCSCQDQTCQ